MDRKSGGFHLIALLGEGLVAVPAHTLPWGGGVRVQWDPAAEQQDLCTPLVHRTRVQAGFIAEATENFWLVLHPRQQQM